MDTASAARNEPRICPFLHAIADDGSLGSPILWPDQTNRCAALGDAAPQSLRQQEYACLERSHLSCPRHLRGSLAVGEPQEVRSGLQLTPAIAGALLVLVASFALSVAFVFANGGMTLPGGVSPSPLAAQGSIEPAPSAPPQVTPATSDAPTPEPSSEATPEASVEAETSPPNASSLPTAAPSASPSSDRYALLRTCPDAPDCWIYVVRSGDNLVSIARHFGVPLADVYQRNPWTETQQLVAGQELRLPPPTR